MASARPPSERDSAFAPLVGCTAALTLMAVLTAPLTPVAAQPQDGQPTLSQSILGKVRRGKERMLLSADELIYDYQKNVVSAVGSVQIYYDGGVIEAHKVTYDRRTNKVLAEGNVRYRAKDGRVVHAEMLEVTDDFREGFANSLLVESPDKTRFAAARSERSSGNLTVYQSGIYTACEPCKDDPRKPPLWQIKAARIIHDENERMVRYENARLEFWGIPVAWVPFMSHPDPTVKRKSGFLAPSMYSSSKTGFGLEIPYFWALAPNYDATVSVQGFTRQGALLKGEWRHRLANGAYTVRAAGIYQLDIGAFRRDDGTVTPGYREFRGSIESNGEFHLNKRWKWGWDATLLSDRTFLTDYSLVRYGTTERTNQLYLIGQGDRSYFDMRAMGFIGLSEFDRNNELPLLHPVLDYRYIFGQPVMGGELSMRMNLTSLSRSAADFDPTSLAAATPVSTNNGFNTCDSRSVVLATNPGNCVMRGMPGNYTRGSGEVAWRKTGITSWGQMVTPFMVTRGDVAYRDAANDPGVSNFISTAPEGLVRAMPAVGVESRWPLIAVNSWGTQVLEPIAQMIVRPNETQIGKFPNEDAQSLVFDDTNLFSVDKYSGYDRIEGGTRVNAGVQYTANVHRFGTVNVLFGQSYHLFGRNSFAYGDMANTGLQSGLEDSVSDYVARAYFQPTKNLSFITRYRLDKDNLELRRLELESRSTWDRLTLSTIYARYDAQPLVGYFERREGIYQTAALKVHDRWTVGGGIRYDFDRSQFDFKTVSVGYLDECFAMTAQYIADYTRSGNTHPEHKFLLRMNLRTIGSTGFSTHFGATATPPTTPLPN